MTPAANVAMLAAESEVLGSLGSTQRCVLRIERKFGRALTILAYTVIAIVGSIITCLGLLALWGEFDHPDRSLFIQIAIGVPAVLSPLIAAWLTRMTFNLHDLGDELAKQAVTDPLTGVSNRRGFFERVARCDDSTGQMDVAMVDLDDFKQLNDSHGHALGDRALQIVADWLSQVVEGEGLVARLGGDEFAVVAPQHIATQIEPRMNFIVDGVRFTASAGRAAWVCAKSPIDATLAAADSDLYATKQRHQQALAPPVETASS